MTGDNNAFSVFYIPRTKLDSHGYALHLVLRKLPARRIVAVVQRNPHGRFKLRFQLQCRFHNAALMRGNGYNNRLYRRNSWRQSQPVIVAVRHDNSADKARGNTPRSLMRIGFFIFSVAERNIKRTGKSVSEIVRRSRLKRLPVMHKRLDSIS